MSTVTIEWAPLFWGMGIWWLMIPLHLCAARLPAKIYIGSTTLLFAIGWVFIGRAAGAGWPLLAGLAVFALLAAPPTAVMAIRIGKAARPKNKEGDAER